MITDGMISRLRRWARADVWGGHGTQGPFLEDVANILEQQEAEIKRLREALEYCSNNVSPKASRIARSALASTTGDNSGKLP